MTETQVKRTVLLVDDDDDFLFQHRLHLETAGFDVLVAHGQKEAEAILAGVPGTPGRRPDLAVIDVMMENPDAGFTLCHRIRKQDPSIPVILVTSVNSETGLDVTLSSDEQRSWIKADALLSKPIRFEQLQREIDRVFNRPAVKA
jgi:CheY-like chemotaxis protein